MKRIITFVAFAAMHLHAVSQLLPGFKPSGLFDEQQMVIENAQLNTRILINAPLTGFGKDDHIMLVFYALPNGNTIEQTVGRHLNEGDDWHFDIQHIGAQTRFLRKTIKNRTIVVVYLETKQKSWPAWKSETTGYSEIVKKIVDDVRTFFEAWSPEIVLNGHSGGGRFIFSYLDAFESIPGDVVRIAFLDSSYGYEDTIYGSKISGWLQSSKDKYLCTIAYNDSVVVYNGNPLVSPTGGTWYRSRAMKNYLEGALRFSSCEKDSLVWEKALKGRVEFIFKPNPGKKIYHTRQVEYNGFIQSILSGTKYEQKEYRYFGERAYSDLITDIVRVPVRRMNIPPRDRNAESGSEFMKRISELPLDEREEEIFKSVASGNIPGFLRNTITLTDELPDDTGVMHEVIYEVMPDYLSVGSDEDFCRVPMNPQTAQRLATLFGASLITSKVSDLIYNQAQVKLVPYNYIPDGNANELVTKFVEHNAMIEKQLDNAGGEHGQLVAGIKKDVIISSGLELHPGKVIIYGWHKPDGKPIQPVYRGHVNWYVDYSHGIRLITNQVIIDGKVIQFTDLLKDPVLYRIFTNDASPLAQPNYTED